MMDIEPFRGPFNKIVKSGGGIIIGPLEIPGHPWLRVQPDALILLEGPRGSLDEAEDVLFTWTMHGIGTYCR